ncbi:hypothetical protein HDU93_007394 [Gonapodya sp. JEL0774]|nr:hypothetical protein HDU93_007394 [Gonapodya sp. JEL0774]
MQSDTAHPSNPPLLSQNVANPASAPAMAPAQEDEDPLRLALALIESLRAENELYQINFNKLRTAHEELQDAFASLSQEKEDAIVEKRNMEDAKCEQDIQNRIKLDEKTREIEDLKAALNDGRRDEEVLRQRFSREWEDTHKRRTKVLEGEVESYRSSLNALRKEHEMLKVELEQQDKYPTALSRALKEAAVLECTSVDRLNNRRLAEEQANSRHLDQEVQELKGRIKLLEAEYEATAKALELCKEERDRVTKEVEGLKLKSEEASHRFAVEIEDIKLTALKERQQVEQAAAGVRQRLREMESSAKTSENRLVDLRLQLSTSEREHLERLKAVVQEERAKRDVVEEDKQTAEKKIAALERASAEMEARDALLIKEQREELSRLRSSLSKTSEQLAALELQARDLRSANNRLEGSAKESRQTDEERRARIVELEEELDSERKAEEALRNKIAALESTIQSFQNESLVSAQEDNKLQLGWAHERAHMQRQLSVLRTDNESLADKMSEVVATFDKHHALFKTKYAELKKRLKSVSTQCESLRIERDGLARELAAQATRAREREMEQERNRTKFLSMLQEQVAV